MGLDPREDPVSNVQSLKLLEHFLKPWIAGEMVVVEPVLREAVPERTDLRGYALRTPESDVAVASSHDRAVAVSTAMRAASGAQY